MKISKRSILVLLIEFVVFCGLFWLIDSYIVNKQCKNTDNDTVISSELNTGPRTLDEYSEEERQIYYIVMDECVYDLKLRYKPADDDDLHIITPCTFVAKDIVRVIFNSGTLSPKYTIHDVYQESKDSIIKIALEQGTIIPKDRK